ncbi:hypothetical protein V7S43_002710 [Phytophthora oleae]|uniref:Uncharacterized protein n=1 Tax=Phytophthora oleae TaxID=2107226 RepID=A0ABD3G0H7_9STRA
MWPFSYNKCELGVINFKNQCISNDKPGYGLNPNQGRGAPEINLLEGGAKGADVTNPDFVYTYDCLTPGANMIDVLPSYYEMEHDHKSTNRDRVGHNYVCWVLDGNPIFEVKTDAFSNVPQNSKKDNPQKWGTMPPSPGSECRGDGNDPVANAICGSVLMDMKINHTRLYFGCDPETQPAKKGVGEHIDEFVFVDNAWKEVSGKAFCKVDVFYRLGAHILG